GILNCFKKEKPPFQIAYIEDYDPYKEQILITYYTGDDKDIESILVDGEEVCADYEKIVKYDFLDRVFCYQKRLWISIPKNSKNKLEIFVNNEQVMI
ncbi:capsular biosynthesis protein, partial [Campylobacter sp. 1569]|nr:capsular biosynthesis protein [Campylobacter sp. 1569]